ncbi:hypothetical protein BT96DRAFT_202220 [Gymnopus androsaceus JB14]|uniref:Uncharacterized protein n=1 Tax=Gymnopus androsaceus JB14 TaxID=1447944 RepID=A0A6A4H762_9AGAR|nr:hypothetical protein BT96DRAFT_202220 [Gymnopus androsaceus JB14]
MEMHALRSIEFSMVPWPVGMPTLGGHASFPTALTLKAISLELRMYCPTLRYFIHTLHYPQTQSRYNRVERIVWIYSPVSRNQNHTRGEQRCKTYGLGGRVEYG